MSQEYYLVDRVLDYQLDKSPNLLMNYHPDLYLVIRSPETQAWYVLRRKIKGFELHG
jgi:hypothetical protein